MIPTPHISAKSKDEIAKIVIMPGDPLRAKFIAENYLDNVTQFNTTRNMLGYTGYFNGKRISVMAHGMGMPSVSIYSYELFNFYDVDTIIRVGTAGGLDPSYDVYDTVLIKDSYTDSNIAKTSFNINSHLMKSNNDVNKKIIKIAKDLNINLKIGRAYTSDAFYKGGECNTESSASFYLNHGCNVVEMESFGLFLNAKISNKNAACLVTVSDTADKITTAEERQNSFKDMLLIALNIVNY